MQTVLAQILRQLIIVAQLIAAPASVMAQSGPDTTARATLHVDGMVGEHCPVPIVSALKRIDGVHRAEASYATHSARVEYDPDRGSLAQIREAIRRWAGFETQIAH